MSKVYYEFAAMILVILHLQTDMLVLTVGQADATVAVHPIVLQGSGPFTAVIDFGAGHSHQKQKHQAPHDGHSAGLNVPTAAAGRPFIAEKLS